MSASENLFYRKVTVFIITTLLSMLLNLESHLYIFEISKQMLLGEWVSRIDTINWHYN